MKEFIINVIVLFVLGILFLFLSNFFMFVFFEPFLSFERGLRFIAGIVVAGVIIAVTED